LWRSYLHGETPFASQEAAQAWFDKHDPEGVAFAYEVIG